MTSADPLYDAETLWQALASVLPGISIEVLPEVGSTNTLLLNRRGDPLPCLLVAQRQTQGRGRLGRQWYSQVGASLTFSLALPLAPVQWDGLSLAVGLALAQALDNPAANRTDSSGQPRLMLKWPNDLWLLDGANGHNSTPTELRGRKLGGVLIETAQRGTQRLCVVGVGLNIAPLLGLPQVSSQTLQTGYAGLQELRADITAPQALACVALPLVQALKRFETQGFAPLVAAYAQRDLLSGQAVFTSHQPPLTGVAAGVNAQGALLLQSGNTVHTVSSGEVSVRLANSPHPLQNGQQNEQQNEPSTRHRNPPAGGLNSSAAAGASGNTSSAAGAHPGHASNQAA